MEPNDEKGREFELFPENEGEESPPAEEAEEEYEEEYNKSGLVYEGRDPICGY